MNHYSILQHFEWAHLKPELANISQPFHKLAHVIVSGLPSNPERTMALRKLLEAKDCAVRAALFKPDWSPPPPREERSES